MLPVAPQAGAEEDERARVYQQDQSDGEQDEPEHGSRAETCGAPDAVAVRAAPVHPPQHGEGRSEEQAGEPVTAAEHAGVRPLAQYLR
jgi:hypothetical protein